MENFRRGIYARLYWWEENVSFQAVLFDIDGTLVNNVTICIEAYRETFRRYTGQRFETEAITRHFGKTEEGILAMYLAPDRLPSAVETYIEVYSDLHQAIREPFAGLRETLTFLQQRVPLGVVTGKSLRLAEVSLCGLGLRSYFQVVEGGFADKADKAESLRRAAQRLSLPTGSILYIGDTAYDIASAAAAGMPVVGAAWSETTTIRPYNAQPALRVFEQVADFSAWLRAGFAAC
jgi:HAD superfamily hydrolase (TIGR01549 family)